MRKPSLSTRLFFASFLVSTLLIAGIYFYVKGFEERRALGQAHRASSDAYSLYNKLLESRGRTPGDVIEALKAGGASRIYWATVAELSATGMHWVLFTGDQAVRGDLSTTPGDNALLVSHPLSDSTYLTLSSGHYLARTWQRQDQDRLLLFYPLAEFERSSRELLEAFLLAGAVLLGLSALFARLISGELLRPLRLLQGKMRALAEQIGLEVPQQDGDEIQAMSHTYLEVARQLETAFEHKRLALEELETYKAELLRVNSNLHRRLFQVKVLLSLWTERDQALDVKDFLSRFLSAILPGVPFEFGCVIIRPIAPFSSEIISARKVGPEKPTPTDLGEEEVPGTAWTDILDPQVKEFLLRESDACLKQTGVVLSKVTGSMRAGAAPAELTVLSFRLKQGDEPLGSVHFLTEQSAPPVSGPLTQFLLSLSAQVSAQLQIQALSSATRLDPLTRLYNRGYLNDRLREEVVRTTRTRAPFSLLFVDIDHFKELNDRLGRQAGDEVLRGLANLVKRTCRGSDAVCRYSGTVLAIALSDTPITGARIFAENLRKAVEAETFSFPGGGEAKVTVSLGLAEFPTDADTVDELLAKTKAALAEAKAEGRNRWKAA